MFGRTGGEAGDDTADVEAEPGGLEDGLEPLQCAYIRMEQQITELDKADKMTTDPKFQPLVDDLKKWLEQRSWKRSNAKPHAAKPSPVAHRVGKDEAA